MLVSFLWFNTVVLWFHTTCFGLGPCTTDFSCALHDVFLDNTAALLFRAGQTRDRRATKSWRSLQATHKEGARVREDGRRLHLEIHVQHHFMQRQLRLFFRGHDGRETVWCWLLLLPTSRIRDHRHPRDLQRWLGANVQVYHHLHVQVRNVQMPGDAFTREPGPSQRTGRHRG